MIFPYFVFIALWSAITCQSVDDILGQLNIQVDQNCVRDKIGRNKYENLNIPLENCLLNILQEFSEDLKSGSMEEIATFCRQEESGIPCRIEITETLNPCLTDREKNLLKYTIDSKIAARDYTCQNQDLIREFFQADKSKCESAETNTQTSKCLMLFRQIMQVTPDNAYNKENCQLMEKFTKCVADNLRKCAGEASYKATMGSFYAEINATPCKEYVIGSSSAARLNFVLLVIIILCCLQNLFL